MTQIIAVDFQNKKVIDSQCVPKRSNWKCTCCNKVYTNVDGDDKNVRRIELEHNTKIKGNDIVITVKLCENCCNQLGDIFEKSNTGE